MVTSLKRTSDVSSLRLGPASAWTQHLVGLLELGFCRLDPSIGMGQASGLRLGLGSSSEFGRLTHHYKRTFGNDFIIQIFQVATTVHTTVLKLHRKMNIIIKK